MIKDENQWIITRDTSEIQRIIMACFENIYSKN